MLSSITSFHRLINSLLPFTTPGTPLYQDVIHTIVLCAFLYFLPYIAERRAGARAGQTAEDGNDQHADAQTLGEVLRQELAIEDELQPPDDEPAPPPIEALLENGIHEDHAPAFDAPQPAFQNQQHQPAPRANRENIGAKKARSITRRNQRRQYHGWIREQAEARRAQEAVGAEEREAALQAEKERRLEVEKKLDEKRMKERSLVKAEREVREQREAKRRVDCERFVKDRLKEEGCVEIVEVVEEVWQDEDSDSGGLWSKGKGKANAEEERSWEEKAIWVERLLRAIPGLLGKKNVVKENGTEAVVMTMLTTGGWIVKIDEDVMRDAYAAAAQMARDKVKAGYDGKVTMMELGHVLEDILMARAGG
ncbi:hypothetical protein NA57DRAFT_70424 [Rhizodiscina lignyota]|uniref:Uncharacterized protein n=1 Tax=Rhizodiscina lignyota TaxID=1504668 RepID=A0A9P4ITI9_9PEZI|nr:hypothetical protein NA57DRAFT_70424 [Rhizodiscina lignyota]